MAINEWEEDKKKKSQERQYTKPDTSDKKAASSSVTRQANKRYTHYVNLSTGEHGRISDAPKESKDALGSNKPSTPSKWYKGDRPTRAETGAQVIRQGLNDPSQQADLDRMFADEISNPNSIIFEKNAQANSRWLEPFGLDSTTPEWMQANSGLLDYAYYSAKGVTPSDAKKGGEAGQYAAYYYQLAADEERTVKAEQAEAALRDEVAYWVSKGYSDDEIKAKIDLQNNKKYKAISDLMLDDGELREITRPIHSATSYGLDGIIWGARNPEKSKGIELDAYQSALGWGTPYTADPTAQAKRDRGNAAWSPYTSGTTMDDTAMKLGVNGKDGFSRDDAWWAQKRSEALASGDDDTIKAYKKAWEAEEFTRQAEEEASEFRDYMARQIESGASVEDIFNEYLFEDNGWENLGKMYDDYLGGIPSDITRSIDFDIAEYKRMAEESYLKKTGVYSTPEYESQITDATGGVKTNDEASQKIEEGYKLNHDIQNKPFIPSATSSERKAMRMYNTPYVPKAGQPRMMAAAGSMSDVSFVTYDAIQNGTGGKQQMDIAKQKSAVGFANENFVDAITNMNTQVPSEADYFKGANEGAYNMLAQYDAFKPILESGKIPTDDEFYAFIAQTFNTPDMLMSPERQMLEEAWALSAGAREFAADAVAGETEKQVAGQEMYDNIEASVADAFGRDTDNYRSVMATYEAAIPYVRGVPKTYNAYDPYQLAAMQEGATPESTAAALTNSRCQNARNIRYLQAQVDNFKELSLPQEIIDNAQQQLDDLIAQNEILNAHKLQENEDFDAQVAAFDSAFVGNNAPSGASPQSDEINRIIANPGSGKALYQSMMGQQGSQYNVKHLLEWDDLASYMTDGERGNYKYIAMTQGVDAAAQYFLNLEENLKVRRYEETTEATSEFASQNAGTAALATAGSVLLSPLEALEGIDTLVSGLFGEEQNPYDNLISATKGAAREGTKDLAADALKDNPVALSIFNVLYDATTSGADSALTGLVGGGGIGGSILMGFSGFENAVNDALMRGASQKDAFIYGIASAAIEAYTEHSQISKMFEAFDAGSAGVKGFMETVLSGFVSETYEEGLSSLLGTVADDYIMQSMSNRDLAIKEYMALGLSEEEAKIQASRDVMTDILYSGLVGGISGAETSGAGYVGGKLVGKSDVQFEQAPGESDVQPEQTTEPGTPQERAVAALATATAPGVGEAQQAATVTGALASFEVAPDEANAASKTIVSNGWTRKVQNMFSTATDPNTLSEAITWAVNTASSKAASIMKENINPNNVVDAVGRLVEAYKAERQNPELAAEYDAAVTESMEADETVKIQEQLKKENSRYDRAEADVTKEKAKLAKAREDIATHQSARQEIAAENSKLNERLKENPADTQASAQMIANKQKWSDLGKQIAAINQTIPAIKNAVKKAAQALQTVTDDIANEARSMAKEVVAQRKAETEALRAQEAEQAEQQRQVDNETVLETDDFISTMLSDQEVSEEDRQLIEQKIREQKAALAPDASDKAGSGARARFVTQMSKRFGVTIRVMDTTHGGQHLRYNGAYDPKTDSIVIDSQATQSDVIYGVLLHELTHKAERSDDYQEFASSILKIKYGDNDQQLATDIKAKQDSYNSRLQAMKALDESVDSTPLTEDAAKREIVADLTREILFGDEGSIQKLCAEKPSVARRMLETIKNFINKLRGVKDPALDQLNQARELFEKALDGKPTWNEPREVQYALHTNESEKLLSASEYRRLSSNWLDYKERGYQFTERPTGGIIVAMDNLIVYTDNQGNPVEAIEVSDADLWQLNNIQQDLIEMEKEGYDIETQRELLEGVYGEESTHFRKSGAVSQPSGQNRAGTGRTSGTVREGNYGEVSAEDGGEITDTPTRPHVQYSLPSDNLLDEMVGSYLSRQTEPEPQTARPQGRRQFVEQTMPNTEAVPEWIWREFQNKPDELNYDLDTNREQVERGWQRIQQNGHDAEMNRLMEADRFSADDTAEANLMMAMALRNDDPATFMALASKYNKEGTEAGKELQARKLFSKMSPTGARIWVAGKLESQLGEYMRTHRPKKQQIDRRAEQVANQIRDLDDTNVMRRLMNGEDVTIDSSNNRWGIPVNQQQQALIDHYGLNNVARPGIFYNRATTEQRMLEAILATPNPLQVTGNGLNLIQRLELIQDGQAVITNADLDYIGTRLAEFVGAGAEAGGRAADVAIARAYEAYGNIAPATLGEKARTWRYISMLTSVPSAIRNVIGNAGQNLVNAASHGLAVEIDKRVSGKTGRRTAAHLDVQERVNGWKAFVEETKNTFRDYFVDKVTTQRGADKYSTNQRGRVYQTTALEAARNVEGFMMSFGDRNVWRKAYVNSLAEQQKLADQGLLYNDDGTTRTNEQMIEQAELDANYATFTEDNQVSQILGQLKRVPGIGIVVDYIMPFTGVPANITRRMIQYSPAGVGTAIIRRAYDRIQGNNFNQKAFVDDLARGITGSALMGVGILLAQMGAIKMGTGEEEDKKKYGLQTAMGQQYTPYIYNPFTDEYVSLAVFSPAASALTMGAAAWSEFKDSEDVLQSLINATLGSFDQIMDASYMTGLQDVFGGYGSIGENVFNAMVDSVVSQNIPTILNQIATTIDPYVRDTKDKNAIIQTLKTAQSKILGLRELLPEKVDVTGQSVKNKEGLRPLYDPFTTTDASENPVVTEVLRLSEVLGDSSMLPSDALSGTKDTLSGYVREGGKVKTKKFTVDGEGKETYRKRYGELWMEGGVTMGKKGERVVVEGLRDLIDSRRYQNMTDDEKAKEIKKIVDAAKIGASMEAFQIYGSNVEE